jgi:Rrf2 family transcriptional regulator, cysteine metabolism repressor
MLLVDLAEHDGTQPVSLKSVAERQGLSEHYLEQLIAPLRNAGFVRSIRGAYGGYVLARPKAELKVLDIILTLEGPLTIVDDEVDDGFQDMWTRLRNAITSVLESISLQDLLDMRKNDKNGFMFYI